MMNKEEFYNKVKEQTGIELTVNKRNNIKDTLNWL